MSIQAYPLCWPTGWRRISPANRRNGSFNRKEKQYSADGQRSWQHSKFLTVSDGIARILDAVEKMGIDRQEVVISTNVRTRLDGLPRSGEKEPDDPGAAVYWRNAGAMQCMAIDRYTTVADNLAAIAATLEAMRAIERHGGAEILNRAFTGFKALNASNGRTWWDVLEVRPDATPDGIRANYRRLARNRHPDMGGSHDAMAELNAALEMALQAVTA